MKKYNIINNTLGWLIFLVATFTYMATIEPTASFWDCPEFIAQAFKSEVGHPPGNPIFILAGRFAANFAGGDVMAVAKCVNAMSAILSAATILLLFWTITHLVKKLVVRDEQATNISPAQYLVIMGSGICGALAYTWSDTFWFSAVEAEVYAFSSFCTALVVWLMLKWEDRADAPQSDRWLILIAYVFGFSLGVHLLNLLCIPALALIFYYRKFKNSNVKGSLLALLISFAIIVLILWGLEPGFVELGGYFDLFFVNVLGMPFNSGVVFYALLTLGIFSWCIFELYKGKSDARMRLSFFLSIMISGMAFMGNNLLIPALLLVGLGIYLFKYMKRVPVRIFGNIIMSVFMIFVGFSCYSIIIIRSSANTPLDENSPNNMYALSSYLSRDQYGKTPLLYGPLYTCQSPLVKLGQATVKTQTENGSETKQIIDQQPVKKIGNAIYARQVKSNPNDPDRYYKIGNNSEYVYPSELCTVFPRAWSQAHTAYYDSYLNVTENPMMPQTVSYVVDEDGNPNMAYRQQTVPRPSFSDNMAVFFGYQLDHMYFRYFLWNFAGRQNDIQSMSMSQNGDVIHGNWITGFSAIDNSRLGNQELLPEALTTGNKGHNVFYCLPLILGLIGLFWQAFAGQKGIEQFWVVFFLFFMTGIAIVLYLNQPPMQPRERDYAYAGSFYAFAIWIGMGVAGLWRIAVWLMKKGQKAKNEKEAIAIDTQAMQSTPAMLMAAIAALIGLLVPLQMVSQTWDDHDRSGRYAARDFGMNYLSSVAPNGIIFTNGDNDTFPLWYLQEVEDFRTDVRVVNLSYLATDWYIAQMQRAAYKSAPLPMQANNMTYAYDNRQVNTIGGDNDIKMPVSKALEALYSDRCLINNNSGEPREGYMPYHKLFIPGNTQAAIANKVIKKEEADQATEGIDIDLRPDSRMTASDMMILDIINSSIIQGWKRPVYFACTIADNLYAYYAPYMHNTGMAYQMTPVNWKNSNAEEQEISNGISSNTDVMYENVTKKFKWGGLDTAAPGSLYLDETIRRMVSTTRLQLIRLCVDLIAEANAAQAAETNGMAQFMGMAPEAYKADRLKKALEVVQLMETKLPEKTCLYESGLSVEVAKIYQQLSLNLKRDDLRKRALELTEQDIQYNAQMLLFAQSLPEGMNIGGNEGNALPILAQTMVTYEKIDANAAQAMLKKIQAKGVNTQEVTRYIQAFKMQNDPAYEQMMQASQQEAVNSNGKDTPQDESNDEGEQILQSFGLPGGTGKDGDMEQN